MPQEEYPSNSHKSREAQRQKAEKLVTEEVVVRKKNGLQKFAESLIAGGAASVRDYVVKEIIMPKARDVVYDVVKSLCDNLKDGTRDLLYGKGTPREGGAVISPNGGRTQKPRDFYAVPNLTFSLRGEAERVLQGMKDYLLEYGSISVADMCDMAGITPNSTDYNWGWGELDEARVDRVREGWILRLPKAVPFD